jgi:S1-C subfamily serine protease
VQRELSKKVKAATVAVGLFKEKGEGRPFITFGSGFCVDPSGIIITCRHVVDCFNETSVSEMIEGLPSSSSPHRLPDIRGARPHAFFYSAAGDQNMVVYPVPVEVVAVKTDFDLAGFRIAKHKAFERGYPALEIAGYEDLYEGMEIGTCGFPLGNGLEKQLGTVSSSFTFGRLSSVIPAQGVPIDYLKGFQLDLTATHGNSGGPVFTVDSGRVFGVLQRGVLNDGAEEPELLAGIVKAEPIYRLTKAGENFFARLKKTTEQDLREGRL